MRTKKIFAALMISVILCFSAYSQEEFKGCSIGSSLFLLGNLDKEEPPYYGQLNFGYYLTPDDVLIVEGISWTYYEPLGTYGRSDESYDGRVSAYGIGVGYQRFFWKGLYSSLLATPFIQRYYDEDGEYLQSGFQLYLQCRIGYRLEFFDNSWFIEPSGAFNYWPVNLNVPDSFEQVDEDGDAPNYYLFEPGLHFGLRF